MKSPNEKIILTPKGLEKLKKELQYLKNTKRKEIASKIKESSEFGDISENAEFEQAKDDQAFLEGRIAEIEHLVKNAQIVENCQKDVISPGCRVTLKSIDGINKYSLVGFAEANPDEGSISTDSILGKSIVGKMRGEKVAVKTPSGEIEYEVVEIE